MNQNVLVGVAVAFCLLGSLTPKNLSGAERNLAVTTSFTYGVGGTQRPKKILTGESIDLAVQISGLELTPDGDMKYSVQLDLLNSSKQLLLTRSSGDQIVPLSLGTNSAKMSNTFPIPKTLSSGNYWMRVVVSDLQSKTATEEMVAFEILANDFFEIGSVVLAKDAQGAYPAGMCFNAGEGVYVHFVIHNAEIIDGKWKVGMKLKVLDKNKKVVGKESRNASSELIAPEGGSTSAKIGAFLNRDGEYVLQLEVEDLVGKKTTQRLLPIVVVNGTALSK